MECLPGKEKNHSPLKKGATRAQDKLYEDLEERGTYKVSTSTPYPDALGKKERQMVMHRKKSTSTLKEPNDKK